LIFIGLVMAVVTLAVETLYDTTDRALAVTMGFVVFSLFNIVVGLNNRSESGTLFQMSTVTDRRQLGLYGLALLLTFLPTELGVTQRILGLTSLDLNQWLIGIGLAIALVLISEVMKFFLRRGRKHDDAAPAAAAPAQA
jgi:Ca2+-transporting ATPase